MQSEHTIVHKHVHSHCLTKFINVSVTVNIIGNYFKHTVYVIAQCYVSEEKAKGSFLHRHMEHVSVTRW